MYVFLCVYLTGLNRSADGSQALHGMPAQGTCMYSSIAITLLNCPYTIVLTDFQRVSTSDMEFVNGGIQLEYKIDN